MKKAILLILGILMIAIWWKMKTRSSADLVASWNLDRVSDHGLTTINLNGQKLTVEVVKTPASLEQGLSGRDKLDSDGMLFVLPERSVPKFWMKEMKFDLDLIWIKDQKIVGVITQVPHPNSQAALFELPIYSPREPIDLVLETPVGKVKNFSL